MPTLDEDREVIESFCRRAAVSALADLVREHDGQLVLRSAPLAEIEAAPEVPKMRYATVTAIPEVADERSRWKRIDKAVLALRVVKWVAIVGLAVAIAWLAIVLVQALAAALVAAAPMIITILVVGAVVLVLLGMGGRGGGGFSGTFSGRMH